MFSTAKATTSETELKREKKMKKNRNPSKMLTNLKGISSRSCDSADGDFESLTTGISSRSIFSRLKTGRRPSLVNNSHTSMPMGDSSCDGQAAAAANDASGSERRPSERCLSADESCATAVAALADSSRASMGRRPSVGGSFTTPRRPSERRPSLDTASVARYLEHHQQQAVDTDTVSRFEQDMSSFRDSMNNNSSTNSSRERNGMSKHGKDGGPAYLVHPTLCIAPKPLPPKQHVVIEALMASRQKPHMMDVSFIAKDGSKVPASRFVMACRVESLEERLFPCITGGGDSHCPGAAVSAELSLGPYSRTALEALVEFCFCGEVAAAPVLREETPDSVRAIVEVAQLAFSLRFRVLGDEAYQWARRVMNRNPPLVCAVYDAAVHPLVKEFEQYALQIMEESPRDTLLGDGGAGGAGIQHLSAPRLEELLTDHDMEEVDELLVFRMILRWYNEKGCTAEALEAAQQCAKKVLTLRFISTADLNGIVRGSGICTEEDVDSAIQERANMDASSGRFSSIIGIMGERVEVQGAGIESVNGVYHRQPDQDGQAMFSKGQGPDSIGLFQWEDTWGIGPSFDLSNMFYECESASAIPPADGWEMSLQGEHPPPICRWIASRRGSDDDEEISGRHLPACFRSEEDLYGN